MSDATSEKSDLEVQRQELLKTYIKGERSKVEELARKKNPSVKQKFWSDMKGSIRAIVEGY
jgi:hypothetical protein